jgi:hypothetical protein
MGSGASEKRRCAVWLVVVKDMAIPDLAIAVWWGLVWQAPWIASLIIAWLLYRRWKTSSASLVALAMGLLIVWAVTGPLVLLEASGALWDPGVNLIIASALRFLGNVVTILLVLFLALAFFWLLKGLADQAER